MTAPRLPCNLHGCVRIWAQVSLISVQHPNHFTTLSLKQDKVKGSKSVILSRSAKKGQSLRGEAATTPAHSHSASVLDEANQSCVLWPGCWNATAWLCGEYRLSYFLIRILAHSLAVKGEGRGKLGCFFVCLIFLFWKVNCGTLLKSNQNSDFRRSWCLEWFFWKPELKSEICLFYKFETLYLKPVSNQMICHVSSYAHMLFPGNCRIERTFLH